MLIFSAITPHPPILLPNIGKENLDQIKKTKKSMETLGRKLKKQQPDIIIIISPHGAILADAFSINLSEGYKSNFEQFGDFSDYGEYKNAPEFIMAIKKKRETDDKIPVVLNNEPNLDHGAGVPLYYLTAELKTSAIVPIGFSLLDLKTHFEFGRALKEEIMSSDKRIAVIASGDLSHRLTPDAPAGYSLYGKEFDEKLVELIKKKDIKSILKLDPELIEEAGECGLRSIIILLGIMNNLNYQPEILSYEGPFGVGYLVANFKLT